MNEKSDVQLLRDYAEHNSEAAFGEIVARYTDLVYSAALRQVNAGDTAADLAQTVFVDLARKAKSVGGRLGAEASLAGWLHRATRYAALNHLRDTRRQRINERQAMEQFLTNSDSSADWEQVRPLLDEGLDSLDDEDREALLLRYFKRQDFRAVGQALGISDDAAQKRVSRAVEKLREFFSKRNVTIGASGLAVLISAHAVQSAPVGLAAAISATAVLAGTTVSTSTTITTTKIIAMTTLSKTLVASTVAVLLFSGIYVATHFAQWHREVTTPTIQTNVYVSRDQFEFAGYATPEATIKTLFWIQSKGDVKATMESASPRFRAILEQVVKAAPKGETTIVNSIVAQSKNYLGYRITGVKKISDDKIVVSVLVDDARLKKIGAGDNGYYGLMANSHKKWQLVRINSEWKYDGPPGASKQ